MKNQATKLRPVLIVSLIGAGILLANSDHVWTGDSMLAPLSAAYADDGPKGAGGPTGTHGSKGANAPSDVGGRGQGQGGPSGDSDAKGPRYGGGGSKPAPGTQGGKPVWAQEGIPSDLELGRLNIVRAPSHVVDRSLATALAALQPKFYDQVITIANDGTLTDAQKITALQDLVKLSFTDETYVRIDSPLENLGLYKDLLIDGKIVATAVTYDTTASATQALLLAAVFVGSASDKTIPVSTATVDAINKIMDLTLPSSLTTEDVAAVAEAVRQAIADAHG